MPASATLLASLFAVAGAVIIGYRAYWLFRRKAWQKELAALRRRMDELSPADPDYNDVRSLYLLMTMDGERRNFHHSGDGVASHGSGAHDSVPHHHEHGFADAGPHDSGFTDSGSNGGDHGGD